MISSTPGTAEYEFAASLAELNRPLDPRSRSRRSGRPGSRITLPDHVCPDLPIPIPMVAQDYPAGAHRLNPCGR